MTTEPYEPLTWVDMIAAAGMDTEIDIDECERMIVKSSLEGKYSDLVTAELVLYLIGRLRESNAEIERLRKGIQDYLAGNYPSRQRSKLDKCSHGSYRYESCEACTDDYFAGVLKAKVEPATQEGETG